MTDTALCYIRGVKINRSEGR